MWQARAHMDYLYIHWFIFKLLGPWFHSLATDLIGIAHISTMWNGPDWFFAYQRLYTSTCTWSSQEPRIKMSIIFTGSHSNCVTTFVLPWSSEWSMDPFISLWAMLYYTLLTITSLYTNKYWAQYRTTHSTIPSQKNNIKYQQLKSNMKYGTRID